MLKLTPETGATTVSPSTLCLPLGFERQVIVVTIKTGSQQGEEAIYMKIKFKLTVTPR